MGECEEELPVEFASEREGEREGCMNQEDTSSFT